MAYRDEADLFIDALGTAHRTGKSPSQLADELDALCEAVRNEHKAIANYHLARADCTNTPEQIDAMFDAMVCKSESLAMLTDRIQQEQHDEPA